MAGSAEENGDDGEEPLFLLAVVVGLGMVAVDIAGVYIILDGFAVPRTVTYGGAVLTALIIGGSFAFVTGARLFDTGAGSDAGEKSALVRVTEIIVAITVLSGVSVFLGYGGGLVLTVSAALGGPDPKTDDGEFLRDRLLDWTARNREFMRTDGHGELPVTP